jgi:SAM-dependent methyltransferase
MTDIDKEIMDAYTVIFDGLQHLGPGDPDVTGKLVARLREDLPTTARIADFGCGTGASTLALAEHLPQACILALDMNEPFLAQLNAEADARGLGDRIYAVTGDMGDPPPLEGIHGEFDLIWSESAIYSIGRSNALSCWHPLLKPGGWLVFSEIVWDMEPDRRAEQVAAFWEQEYPGITMAEAVLDELGAANYAPLDPVYAGAAAWSNYYEPLRKRLHELAGQTGHSPALRDVMASIDREIAVYDKARGEVALMYFLARKQVTG